MRVRGEVKSFTPHGQQEQRHTSEARAAGVVAAAAAAAATATAATATAVVVVVVVLSKLTTDRPAPRFCFL